jgi:hypothetical protein
VKNKGKEMIMLNNEQELSEKISGFLSRKEAQFPELAQAVERERLHREQFKPSIGHSLRFAFGSRH